MHSSSQFCVLITVLRVICAGYVKDLVYLSTKSDKAILNAAIKPKICSLTVAMFILVCQPDIGKLFLWLCHTLLPDSSNHQKHAFARKCIILSDSKQWFRYGRSDCSFFSVCTTFLKWVQWARASCLTQKLKCCNFCSCLDFLSTFYSSDLLDVMTKPTTFPQYLHTPSAHASFKGSCTVLFNVLASKWSFEI